ncbi:unnamed protein product [Camellia sinensis]
MFVRCESCGAAEPGTCEGHFGYIELPIPVYHPSHVSELKRLLSLVCFKCLKLRSGKDSKSKAYPYRSRLIPFTEIWCILGQREKIYAFFIQVIHGKEVAKEATKHIDHAKLHSWAMCSNYEISVKSNYNFEKPFLHLARKLAGHEAELAAAASQPLPDDDDDAFD